MTVPPATAAATPAGAPPRPDVAKVPERIAETARQFEGVLMGQLAKTMLEAGGDDSLPGGHAEAMFRGMLGETLGAEMAKRGGVGLAPAVMEQMLRMQEQAK